MEIKDLIVNKSITLRDALLFLEKSSSGFLFIVDDANCLLGVLTDGDIRRL